MSSLLLDNYNLSSTERFTSLAVSEIGLRHCRKAWNERDVVHGLIGLLEIIPFLGAILSFMEMFFASLVTSQEIEMAKLPAFRVKLIKSGSQNDCSGNVETDKAKAICAHLNSSPEKGVAFQEHRVTAFIMGGTCSAMSFEFADRYLKAKEAGLSPEEAIDRISPDFEQSNLEFRTRQSAFNTICKSMKKEAGDFKKAKIAAMLRFHQRKVVKASDCFDLDKGDSLKKIEKILKQFQQGVFVVRCILENRSEKGEAFGHSTILIRDGGQNYFYDPAKGISELETGYEASVLHELLSAHNRQWGIYSGRIYQIA